LSPDAASNTSTLRSMLPHTNTPSSEGSNTARSWESQRPVWLLCHSATVGFRLGPARGM
jgi:hypothetical protein